MVRLEFPHVADPPDTTADAVVPDRNPFQSVAIGLIAQPEGWEPETVGMAAVAEVMALARARFLEELPERLDELVAVEGCRAPVCLCSPARDAARRQA